MFNLTALGPPNPFQGTALHPANESLSPIAPGHTNPTILKTSPRTEQSQHSYEAHLRRHERAARGPQQTWKQPVTSSQQIGWDAQKPLPEWAKIKHYPAQKSETTRYVELLGRADPQFSLF